MLLCINPFYLSWVLSCVLCVFIVMFILSSLGVILLVMNFGGGYTPFMFRAIASSGGGAPLMLQVALILFPKCQSYGVVLCCSSNVL